MNESDPPLACREASQLISVGLDAPLPFRQRCRLWYHLMICRACRLYRGQLRLLDRTVRRGRIRIERDGMIRLDDEARRRIVEAMRRR